MAKWNEKLGEMLRRVYPKKEDNMQYLQHLHPRTDPNIRKLEPGPKVEPAITKEVFGSAAQPDIPEVTEVVGDDYQAASAAIRSKIQYRHSDYNELLTIAETLEGHVPDRNARLRLASKILKDTKSRYMTVDINAAINDHINDIETHRKLIKLNGEKPAAQVRFDALCNEYNELSEQNKDIDRQTFDLESDIKMLEEQLKDKKEKLTQLKEKYEHNRGVQSMLSTNIEETRAALVTPFDKATDEIVKELLYVKEILNDHS